MDGALDTILDAVGGTPIVRLSKVGADAGAELYVKCEYLAPSGSAKDRIAARMIDAAAARGALAPGGTIVEATAGETGLALAVVGAVRGYACVFVVPEKTSLEKIAALRAYGARVVVAPAAVAPDDPRAMDAIARKIVEETPGAYFVDQFASPDNPAAHALTLGAEIVSQTGSQLDAVVAGIGTGGTLIGIGRALRAVRPDVALVGVDPVGSVYFDFVLTGRVTQPFPYKLEGIGADFLPRTADLEALDELVRVDDRDAFRTARELVRREGLFVGGSSGAAVFGAIEWARRQESGKKILVILPDGAGRYLSKIYNDEWMQQNGLLDDEGGLGTVAELLLQKGGDPVITARADDRVRDVIARMKGNGISQLPILRGDALIGAVTEVDLLRYLVSGESSLDGSVEPLVESDYATVAPSTRIEALQRLLSEAKMAIVLQEGRIAGIVTKIDLIDYLARRAH